MFSRYAISDVALWATKTNLWSTGSVNWFPETEWGVVKQLFIVEGASFFEIHSLSPKLKSSAHDSTWTLFRRCAYSLMRKWREWIFSTQAFAFLPGSSPTRSWLFSVETPISVICCWLNSYASTSTQTKTVHERGVKFPGLGGMAFSERSGDFPCLWWDGSCGRLGLSTFFTSLPVEGKVIKPKYIWARFIWRRHLRLLYIRSCLLASLNFDSLICFACSFSCICCWNAWKSGSFCSVLSVIMAELCILAVVATMNELVWTVSAILQNCDAFSANARETTMMKR